MECIECYSEYSRITPLLKPEDCLKKHLQYICGNCGRCICIDKDKNRNVWRWNFPFKSLDIAKLYLRVADFTTKKSCGIYEILDSKGKKSYKIFVDLENVYVYLSKNKGKNCIKNQPLYIRENYQDFPNTKIKFLNVSEVEQYLSEREL